MNIVIDRIGNNWFLTRRGDRKVWILSGPYKTKEAAEQVLADLKTGDA